MEKLQLRDSLNVENLTADLKKGTDEKMKHLRRLLICMLLLACFLAPRQVRADSTPVKNSIEKLEKRFKNKPEGGIALVGSSSLSRWKTAGKDFASYNCKKNMIYNFGVQNATFKQLIDEGFISIVAEKKPKVVVVFGANDLRKYAKRSEKNNQRVNIGTADTITLIIKLRKALIAQGVSDPQFIIVSAIKSPKLYSDCEASGKSCNIWNRIDMLNKNMKSFSQTFAFCTYMDLEKYYYTKTKSGTLKFYLNSKKLCDKSKTATVDKLISKKKKSPYFSSDLNHPSSTAYKKIWSHVAKKAIALYPKSDSGRLTRQQTAAGLLGGQTAAPFRQSAS